MIALSLSVRHTTDLRCFWLFSLYFSAMLSEHHHVLCHISPFSGSELESILIWGSVLFWVITFGFHVVCILNSLFWWCFAEVSSLCPLLAYCERACASLIVHCLCSDACCAHLALYCFHHYPRHSYCSVYSFIPGLLTLVLVIIVVWYYLLAFRLQMAQHPMRLQQHQLR